MVPSHLYLEALIHGDNNRIKEIYQQSFPSVEKFIIHNSGSPEDARDTFQKALLQIAVRYKKEVFEIRGDFKQYLFVVCKNLWRRELNKSKMYVKNDNLINLHSQAMDQALALLEQQRHELFTDKLHSLSENCKKVLTLYFAKVSYAEMVKTNNYNSETVARQRVFKCKKKLTELIKGDNRYIKLRAL